MPNGMTGGVINRKILNSLSQKSKIFASSLREGAEAACGGRLTVKPKLSAHIISHNNVQCKKNLVVHILG